MVGQDRLPSVAFRYTRGVSKATRGHRLRSLYGLHGRALEALGTLPCPPLRPVQAKALLTAQRYAALVNR